VSACYDAAQGEANCGDVHRLPDATMADHDRTRAEIAYVEAASAIA